MKKAARVMAALAVLAVIPALAGCKVESSTRFKASQLMGPLTKEESTVMIEVAGCADSRDKSKPSDSLVQTQDAMNRLFPESEFLECKREGINSLAAFSVPVEIGTYAAGQKRDMKSLAILRNAEGGGATFFFIPDEATKRLRKEGSLDFRIEFRLTNDTDGDFTVYPGGAFVNGQAWPAMPGSLIPLVLKKGKRADVRLSNVAASELASEGFTFLWNEDPQASAKWLDKTRTK